MCTGTRGFNRKFEDSPLLPIVDYKALNMHKNSTNWTVKFVIKMKNFVVLLFPAIFVHGCNDNSMIIFDASFQFLGL